MGLKRYHETERDLLTLRLSERLRPTGVPRLRRFARVVRTTSRIQPHDNKARDPEERFINYAKLP